jgi:hypothetical protein
VGVRGEEVGEHGPPEEAVDRIRCVEPECATGRVAQLPHRGEHRAHLVERRARAGVEPLPGVGEPKAPRRALDERDAEALLKPA